MLRNKKTHGGDYVSLKTIGERALEKKGKYIGIKDEEYFRVRRICRGMIKARCEAEVEGRMILLKKKAKYEVKDNVRPIVSPACGTRLVENVIWEQMGLRKFYWEKISECQRAMTKRGMEEIMEKIAEWMKGKKRIITIDIKGAFDNISHKAIEEELEGY